MDKSEEQFEKIGFPAAKSDWNTVKSLAQQVLSEDPDNTTALVYF